MGIARKIEDNLSRSSWIRSMFEEGEQLRKIHGADKVYDFTLGNPAMEPPQAFKDELRNLALNPVPGMHKYMSNAGYPETRKAIAEVLAEASGQPVTENHVVMTIGAGGALNVVLKTLLNPGEEVIIFAPYFVEYIFYIENHGGVAKIVETQEDFQLDLQALEAAITPKTKALIINSPNNPTGVIYPADILTALNELLQRKEREFNTDIYVISDEPYAKITYDGQIVPPVFKFIHNSFVVTSHSKDLALPGERIGYAAVNPLAQPGHLIVEGMIFANRTLGYVNAPALMQRLVAKLQRETVDITEYQEKLDILYNHLTSIGFKMTKPGGAFYLFPQAPIADDIAFVRAAVKHNILLVPGAGFGRPGYFRICYCIEKEVIENSLPAFTALAKEFNLI